VLWEYGVLFKVIMVDIVGCMYVMYDEFDDVLVVFVLVVDDDGSVMFGELMGCIDCLLVVVLIY